MVYSPLAVSGRSKHNRKERMDGEREKTRKKGREGTVTPELP